MENVGYIISSYLMRAFFALIIWIIGRVIINFILKLVNRKVIKGHVDPSLSSFLKSIVKTVLYLILIIMVISMLGIQTASLIAILGAAGLAVGLALQGSLANFAGGVLILLFRPFEVEDFIETGGQSGTVKEIKVFSTILHTPDNKVVIIPNGSISNTSITNYSKNDLRRVDLTFSVSYNDDLDKARDVLKNIAASQEKVIKDKDIFVEVIKYADSSIDFVYRVWCKKEDYWTVYFHSLKMAKKSFDEAGLSIPFPQMDVHVEKTEN